LGKKLENQTFLFPFSSSDLCGNTNEKPMSMKSATLLFLDDIRMPSEASGYALVRGTNPRIYSLHWIIVRSYSEFTEWIKANGLPWFISFDHDLGEDEARKKVAAGKSKKKARQEKKIAKSGMDCAKWLVEYCLDNDLELPRWAVHSANPAGYENIKGLLENFKNHRK
jgi:hypothetical protein